MAHIRELKVGIASYTSNEEVLHVFGNISAENDLYVSGDSNVSGVLTAERLYSNFAEFTGGGISGANIVGTSLSISGISTFGGVTNFTEDISVDGHTELDNVNISGVVTATSFVGPVTGNASSATVATNAQGLTGSPSITVTDITATGNVSIAGTLTYEDVTNIDSVGLITARNGLNVSGLSTFTNRVEIQYLDAQLQFENASGTYRGDIQATDTYMNVNAETELRLRADEDVVINDRSTGNRRAKFKDTSVELYYNDQKKIETAGVGATVYGTLTAGAIDVDTHVNITGVITANQYYGDGSTLTNIVTSAEAGISVKDSDTLVGVAKTLNFGDNLSVSAVSAGLVTITASSSGGGVDPVIAGLIF
jgi:cytoskeletal protein CcmA (bactofilin family)